MLHLKLSRRKDQKGFTLVELLIVISLTALAAVSLGSFFVMFITTYSHYQTDAGNYTELSTEAVRISQVLRGLTDISSATANDLVVYAYFSPNDNSVSQVHYYLSSGNKSLLADITPMTSNPPTGTLITANKRTFTVISKYNQVSGVNLFNYYDASGTQLTLPITDEHSIIQIQVNLSATGSYNTTGQPISITIGIRNRKTNL